MNRNARPNNNQLITYYLRVRNLLRIQQYPVNPTYNTGTTYYCCDLVLSSIGSGNQHAPIYDHAS